MLSPSVGRASRKKTAVSAEDDLGPATSTVSADVSALNSPFGEEDQRRVGAAARWEALALIERTHACVAFTVRPRPLDVACVRVTLTAGAEAPDERDSGLTLVFTLGAMVAETTWVRLFDISPYCAAAGLENEAPALRIATNASRYRIIVAQWRITLCQSPPTREVRVICA